ncbi:hypothetical protein ACQP2F_21375 [Actinoplanes sp. CA-030573]|uniref:hypothetical protein n=1 Tax=Actinoplanes sp. CA-030573 TaxID=3239898 RepID=UPI003D9021C3
MTDDDLRSRLRRADPAASVPPPAPGHVSRLIGETMSSSATAVTKPPVRWHLAALAAAAVVLIVAGTGWWLGRPSSPTPGTPIAAAPTPADGPSTTIGLPDVQAKCREPEPARLAADADFAVQGTVTGIDRGMVTLRVTKVFKGADFAEVKVAQTDDSSEQLLGGSGTFVTGKDYLVASAQGDVMICGYSGEVSDEMLALYDKAF